MCILIFEYYEVIFCSVGDMMDIVLKEMYDFYDKGECYVMFWLEGIVLIVCFFVEYKLFGLEYVKLFKIFYMGLMFCYECL